MRRLPPLNALRAFETVARLGSLTRAAEELLVTPTAVGRHVKNLEELLGTPLFVREGGALSLTSRGAGYARSLSRAFELLGAATDAFEDRTDRTVLTLRAFTTFLVRWLIPRLPTFNLAHPEIELRLTTAFDTVDFERDRADVGVRYGDGHWPGIESTLLFHDEVVAFGNTTMRDRFTDPTADEAFSSTTILAHSLRLDDWPDWLEAAGLGDAMPVREIRFDDMSLIYQGVLDGLGVGLTQRRYLQQDLADGRLHLLAPTVLTRDRGFYLVCPAETARRPEIEAFRSWLVDPGRSSSTGPEASR